MGVSRSRAARASPRAELRALKYSTRKAEYIRDRRARRGRRHARSRGRVRGRQSAIVIAELTALRGLGRWTADWFLARCLGRGDVCPAGDLAVRKAFDPLLRARAVAERGDDPPARARVGRAPESRRALPAGRDASAAPGGRRRRVKKTVGLKIFGQPDPGRAQATSTSSDDTRSASTGPTATDPSIHSSGSGSTAPAAVRRARRATDLGDDVAGRDQAHGPRASRDVGRPAREPATRIAELRALCRCAGCTGGH